MNLTMLLLNFDYSSFKVSAGFEREDFKDWIRIITIAPSNRVKTENRKYPGLRSIRYGNPLNQEFIPTQANGIATRVANPMILRNPIEI